MVTDWPALARYWYAPPTTGAVVDPIFGKPLNFYLFTLPAWELITAWLMTLAITILAIAIFFFLISDGIRALGMRRDRYFSSPWRGISAAFAFLLLILSAASSSCSPIIRSFPASPTRTRA
jgi:uncharacterized membrane protein (UPF0182 family)